MPLLVWIKYVLLLEEILGQTNEDYLLPIKVWFSGLFMFTTFISVLRKKKLQRQSNGGRTIPIDGVNPLKRTY